MTTEEVGYAKGRAKRQEIIDVASRLFLEHGFNQTSLRDISKEVGITHTGLLHHFPSKEILLAHVLREKELSTAQRLARSGQPSGLSFLINTLANTIWNTSQEKRVEIFTVLVGEATSPSHPAHEFYQGRYQRARKGSENGLKNAQEENLITKEYSASDLAVMLVAVMDGLQVQWRLDPENFDMTEAFRSFLLALVEPDRRAEMIRHFDGEYGENPANETTSARK